MSTTAAPARHPRPPRSRRALSGITPADSDAAARHEALGAQPLPGGREARPETDPLAARPLLLRQAIAEARDFDQLRAAGLGLRGAVVALHEAHASAGQASAIVSTLADSLTRRAVELAIAELGPPPCGVSWVALGSHGRGEPVPGSDIDSALAWEGEEGDERAASYMRTLGARVCEGLAQCGFRPDERGATAAQGLFVRPLSAWRRLIRQSIAEPRRDKGLIVISLFLDGRVVRDGGGASDLDGELQAATGRRGLLRLMLGLALTNKPPLGRLRGFALERGGEHRGRLDIKHGGLLPITSIARYASLAAGAITARSTPERLGAAASAGTLDGQLARTLADAFELLQAVRLDHHVGQIQRESEPDDYLDPDALDAASRRQLRDALKEVRAVQRRLGRQLSGELAFA